MSYTAIEKMREKNLKKFGIDYPREPRDLRKKRILVILKEKV